MGLLIALAAAASFAAGASAQCVPLADAASDAGLTALLDAVGIVADLDAAAPVLDIATANETIDTPVTLFAPSNDAFAEVASTVAALEPELVLAVLLNHVLPTEVDSAALLALVPTEVETVLGTTLSAALVGEDLIITSGLIEAKVIVTDVETCAGVVHVIDKVLVPALTDDDESPPPTSMAATTATGTATATGTNTSTTVSTSETEVVEMEDPVMDMPDDDMGAYGAVEGAYGA